MITFRQVGSDVILDYCPDNYPTTWIDDEFKAGKHSVRLFKTFHVDKSELTSPPSDEYRSFVVGTKSSHYFIIKNDVLSTKQDVLIADDLELDIRLFQASYRTSIFREIDSVVESQIIVGGEHEDAIPIEDFLTIVDNFPNSNERKLYFQARVEKLVSDYFENTERAQDRLSKYLKKKDSKNSSISPKESVEVAAARSLELEKYKLISQTLRNMLTNTRAYTEKDWQREVAKIFLLIFPQYVAVLEEVRVKDMYTKPGKSTDRYIDYALVSCSGNIDIVEIKKPDDDFLLSRRKYRDNYVPIKHLSGAIIQVEKYCFHLMKSGRSIEEYIAKTYNDLIPQNISINVANPKGFILSGRHAHFSKDQRLDFEFARRSYSNIVDVISYDDLLERIDNIIASLNPEIPDPSTTP